MSEAPPLGAAAEPEADPLSVSLVSFCTSRKKLALRRNLGRTIRGALPPAGAGTGTYRAVGSAGRRGIITDKVFTR